MRLNALSDLPVEVHFEIIKYAFYSSQRARTPDVGSIMVEWEWIERDEHNPSQFPYNIAAVCRLWLAILTTIPECWTRVIIDVASDPRDFLDIFLWSKDLPELAVTITNSQTPNPDDVNSIELERGRVSAIVDALRPHVSRCQSITFEVAFLTSLPSPIIFMHKKAPDLTHLVLNCKIDNAGPPDDYSRSCDLGICEPLRIPRRRTTPELTHLEMTGFWFMFITNHPFTAKWWRQYQDQDFSVMISRFEFQKEGQYTLQNFIVPYTELNPSDLTLCDLSLNHDGPILEGENVEVDSIDSPVTTFKNVSSDVLKSLFFLVDISPNYLTFDNCTFPDEPLETDATVLTLKNISSSNTNLCKFLANRSWSNGHLIVDSCPSFDDNALLALSHREDGPRSLQIMDSPNFTVYGLRQFLETRNRLLAEPPSKAGSKYYHWKPLNELEIEFSCPLPSEEEQEWFRTSLYTRSIDITWCAWDSEKSLQTFETKADSDRWN